MQSFLNRSTPVFHLFAMAPSSTKFRFVTTSMKTAEIILAADTFELFSHRSHSSSWWRPFAVLLVCNVWWYMRGRTIAVGRLRLATLRKGFPHRPFHGAVSQHHSASAPLLSLGVSALWAQSKVPSSSCFRAF